MIIDLILDRQDSLNYSPRAFYSDCMEYGAVGHGITKAMDTGTQSDVQRELCKYITDNGYNPDICKFIKANEWI